MLTDYEGEHLAIVEHVLTGVESQSGVMVKLKEFVVPLDVFWISPAGDVGDRNPRNQHCT